MTCSPAFGVIQNVTKRLHDYGGDRKQAIYGFRGGDMLTFLNAYKDIQAKHGREYKLIHNHRSVADLVEVVDALFKGKSTLVNRFNMTRFGQGLDLIRF